MPSDPLPSSASVTARMSRQRRRDTAPEIELRRRLHALGLRFRVNYPVPGAARRTMDVAFTRARLAVFVDGCFWHACPQHASWPRANYEWWRRKLELNVARDRDTDERLASAGWVVLRVWEHDSVDESVVRVVDALHSTR